MRRSSSSRRSASATARADATPDSSRRSLRRCGCSAPNGRRSRRGLRRGSTPTFMRSRAGSAEHVPDCELAPGDARPRSPPAGSADCALREFARAVEHRRARASAVESRARPRHLVLEMDAYTRASVQARARARRACGAHRRADPRARARARRRARVRRSARAPRRRRRVDARRVIVCTNAYTSALELGRARPALVVHSFMTATAPVERRARARRRLHRRDRPRRRRITACTAAGSSTAASTSCVAPAGGDFAVPAGVRARLARHMRASFRGRDQLAIDRGVVGIVSRDRDRTADHPRVHDNPAVIFNVGYGGTGVALALVCARLAAASPRAACSRAPTTRACSP